MSQHEEARRGVAPRRASELSAGKLEFSEVSPSQAPTQVETPPVLPMVAAARQRDNIARARLRGLIPEKMAHLENGPAGKRAAEKLRADVFPPKDGAS